MMNRLRSGCGGNPELISTAKVGILCVVSMATVLAFTTPTAADVRFVAYDHGVKSAYIEGTIQKTDVDIFSKGVEDSRSTVVNVLLDSHGGDVYAAMAIGRVLREGGAVLRPPRFDLCGCFVRRARERIQVSQPTIHIFGLFVSKPSEYKDVSQGIRIVSAQ